MPISIKDQKMLWGRAAARCSICRNVLVEDATGVDDPAVIGENCHIVAESNDGPRGHSPLTPDQRNAYENLILCCRNHHAVVDKQPEKYTVDELSRIKRDHEEWVSRQLTHADKAKELDDEYYAEIVEVISKKALFSDWLVWCSHVLSAGRPRMEAALDNSLAELERWLARRPPSPKRYPAFDDAVLNFALVLSDFRRIFLQHAEFSNDGEMLAIRRFYKIPIWDPELYHKLLRDYEFHTDLVGDLMIELTRAANLIIENARIYVSPMFMRSEGDLMYQVGPLLDLQWIEAVARYSEADRKRVPPYPGLEGFYTVRAERDFYFGKSAPGKAP